jgi:hypothetical protein
VTRLILPVLEKIILRYSENKSGFFIKIQQVYNQITNVTIESLAITSGGSKSKTGRQECKSKTGRQESVTRLILPVLKAGRQRKSSSDTVKMNLDFSLKSNKFITKSQMSPFLSHMIIEIEFFSSLTPNLWNMSPSIHLGSYL